MGNQPRFLKQPGLTYGYRQIPWHVLTEKVNWKNVPNLEIIHMTTKYGNYLATSKNVPQTNDRKAD
jgi:hypothetical protein